MDLRDGTVEELMEIEIHDKPENIQDTDITPLPLWQYTVIYVSVFLFTVGIITYTILNEDKDLTFLAEKGFGLLLIGVIYYLNGRFLVKKFGLRINYTRKINHFTIWVSPFIIDMLFDLEGSLLATLWNIVFAFIGFILFTIPIRSNDSTNILNTMYCSLDRPEDRPNTLTWLTLQNFLTSIVLIPFVVLWDYWDTENYKFIPLLIATFGDGFAEVIGVRFGKHKYKTRALFTDKEYTRSFEGSACVFITAVIMITAFDYNFKTWELVLNTIFIPPLVTLAEAYAPHTMDNPFIIIVSGGVLSVIHVFF